MKREIYGKLKSGEEIEIVTLTNEDAELKVMTRGATIVRFKTFGVDIIGGYDCLADYEADSDSYQGATVGRVANRIADACFTMDGAIYMVTENDGDNCLHGGSGFSFKIWDIIEVSEDSVVLGYYSPDGEDGFPAGVAVKVRFTLRGTSVIIDYEALPDGKTPIALTNHSYFNLDGFGGVIDKHIVTIYADRYTEVDSELIPTGNRPKVLKTEFDFASPKRIGSFEYDHNFMLCPKIYRNFEKKSLSLAAAVTNGKLELNMYTDQPGVQFYTGNFLGGKPNFRGGVPRVKHGAFCLEAQTEPDLIHRKRSPFSNGEGSGKIFYDAGEVYRQTTVYEVKRLPAEGAVTQGD